VTEHGLAVVALQVLVEPDACAGLGHHGRQRGLADLQRIRSRSNTSRNSRSRTNANLESDGTEFRRSLRKIAADKADAYAYLLRVSMIASLRRAQELG
jgi:hypothetical protein